MSDRRVLINEVDWLTKKQKSGLYALCAEGIDDFYSLCRAEPEPMRNLLGVTEQQYRGLLSKAEDILPADFIERCNNPPEPRPRGLLVGDIEINNMPFLKPYVDKLRTYRIKTVADVYSSGYRHIDELAAILGVSAHEAVQIREKARLLLPADVRARCEAPVKKRKRGGHLPPDYRPPIDAVDKQTKHLRE